MNTIDTLRLFCDGQMSAHDIRALMESMGHSREDFAEAFTTLFEEPGSTLRVGKYRKGEYFAELYLTVAQQSGTL